MDNRSCGSGFPPSEFPYAEDWDFNQQEVGRHRDFTGLLMRGIEGLELNNMQAHNLAFNFEEGGTSGGHQNIDPFPTEEVHNSGQVQNYWRFPTQEGHTSEGQQSPFWHFPAQGGSIPALGPDDIETAGIESEDIATTDEFEQLRLELEAWRIATMAAHISFTRLPYHTSSLSGWEYVKEVLAGRDERFEKVLSMKKDVYLELCELLVSKYGWTSNRQSRIGVEESLAIFISVLRGWVTDTIDERFQHSRATVHRHVGKILDCMDKLAQDEIAPRTQSYDGPMHPYIRCREQYHFFKDCIGAIDGTHVLCRPRPRDVHLYIGRKGVPTMNIMAACDFDLCFTFASVGWQGIWHDYAIFKKVVSNDAEYNFPHPPPGKYYLVDSGYANRTGYLAPYKGCKYHLAEFRRGERQVRPGKELYNRVHSSLRSAIERCFGVWKQRWRFLTNPPKYPLIKQARIVMASMAIHNFIRRRSPQNELWRNEHPTILPIYTEEANPDDNDSVQHNDEAIQGELDIDSDEYMNGFRDGLQRALDYHRKQKRRR